MNNNEYDLSLPPDELGEPTLRALDPSDEQNFAEPTNPSTPPPRK